jgi:hypothetical protein
MDCGDAAADELSDKGPWLGGSSPSVPGDQRRSPSVEILHVCPGDADLFLPDSHNGQYGSDQIWFQGLLEDRGPLVRSGNPGKFELEGADDVGLSAPRVWGQPLQQHSMCSIPLSSPLSSPPPAASVLPTRKTPLPQGRSLQVSRPPHSIWFIIAHLSGSCLVSRVSP